jgi:hypothetical protein
MKEYYGNYLGICINNQDPEYRGRVQIFIPHIMPALYEDWNELGADISIECVGNNLNQGLPKNIVDKLIQILPWSEAALPVIGASVGGSYNYQTGNFNQTSAPEGAVTGSWDGGTALPTGNDIKPTLTAYSPLAPGSADINLQGGYASSRPGLDGEAIVRTLDDFASGKSNYITLAGDSSTYGQKYVIPSLTWVDKSGQTKTLSNIPAYVHDTGSAFRGKGTSRFDIPVSRDLSFDQLAKQPFSLQSLAFRGVSDDSFNEALANVRQVSTIDASSYTPSTGPFYSPQPYQTSQTPSRAALITGTPGNPGSFDWRTAIQEYGIPSGIDGKGIYRTSKGTTACLRGAINSAGYITGNKNFSGYAGPAAANSPDVAAKLTTPDPNGNVLYEKAFVLTGEQAKNFKMQQGDFFTHQIGDVRAPSGGKYGHAQVYIDSAMRSHKAIDNSWSYYTNIPGQQVTVYRLTKEGRDAVTKTNNSNVALLNAEDQYEDFDDGDDLNGPENDYTNFVKQTTNTQPFPLDTTGMPAGLFSQPAPGAMLWVFFREGNPLFPVYFAASYGGPEWQNAYKANGQPLYDAQRGGGSEIAGQSVIRPNNAGAITFTGAVTPEGDKRTVRMAHANGGYLEFHPYGSVQYSPNEHMQHTSGTQYNYCLNREEWTQGDSNHVVMGNQWVMIGNCSDENIKTANALTDRVKELNAKMYKNPQPTGSSTSGGVSFAPAQTPG